MLVEIAVGVSGVLFLIGLRRAKVRQDFEQCYGSQIAEENERLAAAWRASQPVEKNLDIEWEFRPPVFMAPTIRVTRHYRREGPRRIVQSHTSGNGTDLHKGLAAADDHFD